MRVNLTHSCTAKSLHTLESVFLFVCALNRREYVWVCPYVRTSVCIHMVIWIKRETWVGLPTTCLIIQGASAGNSITCRVHSAAMSVLSFAAALREGSGGRKGDCWKGKKILRLLSVVCSHKQAELIIQTWPRMITGAICILYVQSCCCHVEALCTLMDCIL